MKKIEKYAAFMTPPEIKKFWLMKYGKDYNETPANFIEFCLSPEYLGLGEDIYDSILEMGYQIFDSGLTEVVILAGIGCERLGTKIIMSDGKIKSNTEINVGDFLMGKDGTPRKVLEKHSGIDDMYEIIPYKGESKFVTKEHKLYGVWTSRGKMYSGNRKYIGEDKRGNTYESIKVKDYLLLSEKNKKLFKLISSNGVEFENRKVSIPPYLLGLWLGDGTNCRTEITSIDKEVIDYLYKYADSIGALVTKNKDTYKITYGKLGNPKLSYGNTFFKQYDLLNNKHIPEDYLLNSKENRLELLAGLIDTDGTNAGNYFEFYQKDEKFIDQVSYLARSLGFKVIKSNNDKKLNGKLFKNFRLSILGDCSIIPTKIKRKQCNKRIQKKDWLRTGIKEVKYIGKEEYIGFKIDGDELYMWGDFTITHNSGKSFFAQVGTVYMLHRLLCLKDPHKYLGLSKDKPIEMINMGLNATQAKDVIFTGIRNLIVNSEWFRNKMTKLGGGMDLLKTEITFFLGQKNLHYNSDRRFEVFKLISGNSQETAPIGRNLFAGGLDEAAFYHENSEVSTAENIYDAINARIASRFGTRGMTFVISSPKFENDFVARKFHEGLRNPELIFTYTSTTWHFKDRDKLSDEVFVFDHKNFKIIPEDEYKINNIEITDKIRFDLKFSDKRDEYLWVIPKDYYKAFKKSPEKATRDLGAKIIGNIEGFIKTRSFVDLALGKCQNLVDEYGIWHTDKPMTGQVYIHIDLALNRTDKSDCAGIAVSRVKGLNAEGMPIIQVLFAEQIHKEEGAVEIQLSDVRRRVIDLQKSGWSIGLVTLDGYQSIDTMQILQKNGIKSDYLSLDTSLEPYEAFREALYDERVELPNMEIIKEELYGLELVGGKKVDHPKTGSKDLADAIAGSVYNAIRHGSMNHGLGGGQVIRRK